jgi:serine/threonine protein kinase
VLQPGDELAGRYLLEEQLGRGGMGEVWRAVDQRLHRPVAVKVLSNPRHSSHPSPWQTERFRREALITAGLQHPGIAVVHDADQHGDQWFIVMELLHGQDLAAVLAGTPDRRLPIEQVISLGVQIAQALAAAHGRGVIHRDLKPANLFLTDGGQVKICDFGIASAADATSPLTAEGQRLGTPHYMSPEQWQGEQVDARSDLYSFGCVLHALLTGRPPFTANEIAVVMHHHLQTPPPRPGASRAEVPEKLDELVVRLLAKDPSNRPPSADTVTAALAAIREPTHGPPTTREDQDPRIRDRSRRSFVLAGLGVAAVAVPVASVLRSLSSGVSGGHRPGGHVTPGRDTARSTSIRPGAPMTLLDGRNGVRSVTFSPDGKILASASDDGVARLWEVATKTLVKTFTHKVVNPWPKPLAQVIKFNSEFPATLSVAFSPDGASLAVGNGDGTVSLWNVATGTDATLPYLHPVLWNTSLSCVAFNPAGGTLASTYDAPTVRVWNLTTQTSSAALTTGDGHGRWVQSLAFSPSGGILATASGNGNPGNTSSDGLLQLWDASSHTKIGNLAHTNTDVQSLTFSTDGKTLANLRNDGTITLWDVTARTSTATLTGPGSGVTCIASGPDATLASGSDDGTITLWDITSRKSITVLSSGTNTKIHSVAFSPDGKTVASAGRNLTVWTIR